MMKFGSLFSGIGGFDLALKHAGFDCTWQCEIDKACQSVLRKHFNTRIYNDVRSISRDSAEPVDLICGGFPCQDLSVAGKRADLAGERSGLWFEFARIIGEFAPQWVLIENVPGLLSSNGGRDFGIILDQLVKFGYGVAWRVLDAQYFGLAQRRKRVFIVGSLGNGRAAEVLFEREESQDEIETIRETQNNDGRLYRSAKKRGGFGFSINTELVPVLESESGKHTGGAVSLPIVWAIRTANNSSNGWGISSLAYTIDGTNGQGVVVNGSARNLTPTECERLQGFPDGWTDGESDSARYRQLGNAVAVPVVEWIVRRIREND